MSIRYLGETVRIWQEMPMPQSTSAATSGSEEVAVEEGPDLVIDLTAEPTVSLQMCGACTSTAIYYTPSGLACSYHAWEAASVQEATGVDFWIPILIERAR